MPGPTGGTATGHEAGPVEVVLRDGGTIVVRPIEPADADALVRFHGTLSAESTRLRFFVTHPSLSPAEVDRFTTVDHRDREAMVAVAAGALVGVARFDRVPGTASAEIAFVVSDDWQHRGVGPVLLAAIARRALEEGITELVAETLHENHHMIKVFERTGWQITRTSDHEVARYAMTITVPAFQV